jgi:hypothetical protein
MNESLGLKLGRALPAGALAIISVLLATSPAFASNRQAQERLARKACLSGDAAKGVEILAELFVETQNSTYLFNQGRCFEQNRMFKDAISRFEEYLRAPGAGVKAEDKASAEQHIAVCKEKIAEERAEMPLQPPSTPTVLPTPQAQPIAEPTPAAETAPAPLPTQGERRTGLLTAGIITGVVGIGGVVTGIIFNLKANNTVNELEKLDSYSNAKKNNQSNYKTYAWIGYGAGAACAVAGAIMVGMGASRSSPNSASDVALVPAVGPSQMGAMLTGSF